MIPELGHFALMLAFSLSLIQAVIPIIGVWKNNIADMQLSRFTSIGQCFFVAIAFFILGYSFLANDFSIAYVAAHSNAQLPWIYRFCAIWGAHEGSLLLWVFILTIWMMLVSVFSKTLPLKMVARVLAVMAWIAIGFYLFLFLTSDPFVRVFSDSFVSTDLNPILQDPGLVIHPPILYTGYVGFSVVFAFAIAALLEGRCDPDWARWTRPWTQAAWCFLTAGIVLGSWWSYRELGWGGFWFWDPVENASFLPWLMGTALMHSLIVAEKRNALKVWTLLLAIFTFSLSLLGTFLVRSGVLISVHTFAEDPSRGLFLLRFLAIVVGSALFLYAWRAKKIKECNHFHFWSRDSFLLSNNILLFIAMLTVLLGTLYPLIVDSLGLGKISVGPPYFNLVLLPILFLLLVMMGLGPFFHWQRHTHPKQNLIFSSKVLLSVFILEIILFFLFKKTISISLFFILTLAIWLIVMMCFQGIQFTRKRIAMCLAHIGMGVTVIGIILSTTYGDSKKLSMQINDHVRVGAYTFILKSVSDLTGPNYTGVSSNMIVKKNNKIITILHPELRVFDNKSIVIAKTSIRAGIFQDLYVALAGKLPDESWAFRIYVKPFVRWIWAGGLLMILGGILAMRKKHHAP